MNQEAGRQPACIGADLPEQSSSHSDVAKPRLRCVALEGESCRGPERSLKDAQGRSGDSQEQ